MRRLVSVLGCIALVGGLAALANPASAGPLPAGTILLTDFGTNAVFEIDPATGNRTILSGDGRGAGPSLVAPAGIAVLPNGELLVSAAGSPPPPAGSGNPPATIFLIDPATGNRTVLSDPTHGTGPNLVAPRQITLGAGGNLIVADLGGPPGPPSGAQFPPPAIFLVNTMTGNRMILSDATHGTGPNFGGHVTGPFGGPIAVALDASGNILVGDSGANAIFDVNAVTGNRTVVSSASHGSGPLFEVPAGFFLNTSGALFVSSSPQVPEVESIDPLTGNRTILSNATHGSGPLLGSPIGFGLSAGGLLVADPGNPSLGIPPGVDLIDPVTGDRTLVSGAARGTGPLFTFPTSIATVPAPAPATVPEPSSLALLSIGGLALAGWRRWKGKRATP